jgi:hypothetical protein
MNESEETGGLDRVRPCDIRVFRERAREEWRHVRRAETERTRQNHAEMAEHYEMVARLLEAKAGIASGSFVGSLRRMLDRLFPR